jgi:hypothetical protein
MAPADIFLLPFPLTAESGPMELPFPLPNLSKMLVHEM